MTSCMIQDSERNSEANYTRQKLEKNFQNSESWEFDQSKSFGRSKINDS